MTTFAPVGWLEHRREIQFSSFCARVIHRNQAQCKVERFFLFSTFMIGLTFSRSSCIWSLKARNYERKKRVYFPLFLRSVMIWSVRDFFFLASTVQDGKNESQIHKSIINLGLWKISENSSCRAITTRTDPTHVALWLMWKLQARERQQKCSCKKLRKAGSCLKISLSVRQFWPVVVVVLAREKKKRWTTITRSSETRGDLEREG